LIVSGFSVMGGAGLGAEISRWIGVIVAAIGAITAAAWLPYYPVWLLIYVGVAGAVIYGLVAHFGEEAPTS
jgi:hypothetical protein